MKTWTLTISGGRGFSEHTIIGTGENTERAGEQLFTAATAMIRRADIDERPRYTLQLGDQLAAIIQTGDDELGLSDHPATAKPDRRTTTGQRKPATARFSSRAARRHPTPVAEPV